MPLALLRPLCRTSRGRRSANKTKTENINNNQKRKQKQQPKTKTENIFSRPALLQRGRLHECTCSASIQYLDNICEQSKSSGDQSFSSKLTIPRPACHSETVSRHFFLKATFFNALRPSPWIRVSAWPLRECFFFKSFSILLLYRAYACQTSRELPAITVDGNHVKQKSKTAHL